MAPVTTFGGDPQPSKGVAFRAGYDSTCAYCFENIFEGDEIRADGEGGFEHAEHLEEDRERNG
jgi:hypothetical protein